MSNYQTLQYLVQFSYDKASLKEIQDALNNIKKLQEESGKKKKGGKSDAQEQALHLDELSRAYVKYTGKLREQSNQTNKYKADLKKLNDVERENGRLTGAQKQQKEAIITAQKQVRQEQNKERNNLIAINQAADTTGNSYENMRTRMKALSVQIRNTQDPMGKNKEAVQMMQKEYDQLNTKLKKMDSAMGNHQRNVGDYVSSIRSAASAIAVWQGPLGPLAGRLNSLATTLKKVKEMQMANAGASKTLGANIRFLMGATGLGLLIVVLGSVNAFLTKTERGQKAAAIASAGLEAVMNTLGDVFIKVGEAIYNAFKNPQKTISELWAGIQSFTKNILKPTEVFEKVRDSINAVFDDPKTAVKNLWNAIKENIVNRFNSVIDTFGYVGKALEAAFNFDWDAFNENAAAAGSSIVDVVTGVEGTVGKVKESAIALGQSIANGLQPAIDFAVDLGEKIKENVKAQQEEEAILFDMIKLQRELNTARAEQDALIQKTRRYVRENRHEMIEGMRQLDDTIAKEKALGEQIKEKFGEELRIQRARTDRFESDVKEKDKLAEMEAEYYRLLADNETKVMRLQRDRNTVETRYLMMQFKEQKDYLQRRLGLMDEENQRILQSKRGLLNELKVAEKAHTEVFGNEQLKKEMLYQYFIEESRRLEAAGFTKDEAMRRAKANAELRIEKEQLDSEREVAEIRRQYNEQLFDSIQDAAFSSATAIFGERKLIASAETVVDTLKGAQRAFAANPNPIGIAQAAAIVAQGVTAIKKINSTQKGSKSVGSTAASSASAASIANAPSENFGLVEAQMNALPTEIASQLGGTQNQMNPTFILEGEFDSEFLSIKVQEGNNARYGQTVGV